MMSYAPDLDALFSALEKEYPDAGDEAFDQDDYQAVINLCKGVIVLACKEQAAGRHREYSTRIKDLLRYMSVIDPEVNSKDDFMPNAVALSDFGTWEQQSDYVATALDNRRKYPSSNDALENCSLDDLIVKFRNSKALEDALQITQGWTSMLEADISQGR